MKKRGILAAAAALAMLAPGAAQAKWYKVTSSHFTVYAEGEPADLKAYIAKLERYDNALHVLYAVPAQPPSSSSRVTVFVVRDVQKVTGMGGILGVYMPRAGGPVAFSAKYGEDTLRGISRLGTSHVFEPLTPQEVLFHEYAHHFMFTSWPDIPFPGWLTEGFAEYNGTAIINDDGSVSIGAPPNYRAFGVTTHVMSMQDLLESDSQKEFRFDEIQALYGRGWLIVHYLMSKPGGKKQLDAFLTALTKGTDPVKAATAAFGDLGKFNQALNDHSHGRINGFTIKGLKVGKIELRPLTDAESAMMPSLLASKAGVTEQEAPEVARRAERAAEPYPNDPAAQNELAEAEFDAKHYEAAAAAAARALAADPKSLHALVYRGKAEMEMAKRDKVTDPAKWDAIRQWFVKANHVDSENAEPLQLFYQGYVDAGERPSKSAEAGLLYAEVLAPYDPDLRLTAARVLLDQEKVPEARRMLQTVAVSPHAPDEQTKFAKKVIEELDAGDAKKAATDLAAGPPKDKDKKGKDKDKDDD
jgi:tetratricopeptide (TPR) repeat protein